MKRLKKTILSLIISLLISLCFSISVYADPEPTLENIPYPSNTITINNSIASIDGNGTLTINSNQTLALRQSIVLGKTSASIDGQTRIINNLTVNGILSFGSYGDYVHINAKPFNFPIYGSGYYAILCPENTTGSINGTGTINIYKIASDSTYKEAVSGLIAAVGISQTSPDTIDSGSTYYTVSNNPSILSINCNKIDSTNSEASHGNDPAAGYAGNSAFAITSMGNSTITLGTLGSSTPNVIGAPDIFASYGQSGGQQGSDLPEKPNEPGAAKVIINGGNYTVENQTELLRFPVIKNFGADWGTSIIEINGGTIDGGTSVAGIYSENKFGEININGGTIKGLSGISARAGEINISGTPTISGIGKMALNQIPEGDKGEYSQGNGAAIFVNANGTILEDDYNAYGKGVDLTITGGDFTSETSSAIYCEDPNPADGQIGKAALDSIKITNGNFEGAPGEDSIFIHEDVFSNQGTPHTNYISGGTFNTPLQPDQLSDSVGQMVPVTKDNETTYSYFTDKTEAQNYANQNNAPIYPVSDGDVELIPSTNNDPEIIAVDFNPSSSLSYYNISSEATAPSNQQGNLGLTVSATGANNNITPEYLNYTVKAVQSSSTSEPIDFPDSRNSSNKTNWIEVDSTGQPISVNTNSSKTGYRALYCDSPKATSTLGQWFLMYKYTINEVTVGGNKTNVISYSDVTLNYNGGYNNGGNPAIPTGVYSLTATAIDEFAFNHTNPASDTVNFVVSPTNIQDVTIISPTGSQISGVYNLDLSENRTFDFTYTATSTAQGNPPVQGKVVNWTLTCPGNGLNDSSLPYATVNSETGVVTFLQTPPQNTIFILTVNVDGVSQTVTLIPTGTLTYSTVSGIKPVTNPAYAVSSNNYNLNQNIVTTPLEGPIPTDETVKFTSSNTSVIVFQNQNGESVAIPGNSNFTGMTTITATWTNSTTNQTYTTSFELNFVSSSVAAKGVSAVSTLNMTTENPTPQNVEAALTPENTTQAIVPGPNGTFSYTSSDESVAIVDNYGNVTPVGEGTCTITTTASVSSISSTNNKATTTVNVDQYPADDTTIEITPSVIYLVPTGVEGGTTSATIKATLDPADTAAIIDWSTDSEILKLSPNGNEVTVQSTDETGTGNVIASITLEDGSTIQATAEVYVTDQKTVIDPIETKITATSPDFYTVTVAPIVNPALPDNNIETIEKVSIFTWSQLGQTDLDCKVANKNADGTYSYEFPVNNTPENEYYLDANNIIVQAYASTTDNSDGNMVLNTVWNYADCNWNKGVIATSYVQNQGFVKPSVGNDEVAGTTGQALQMEGIRLSTPIEGVDLVYDVHVENIGWMDEVTEGYYAGTMHQNLQIEAIHIKLTGPNADQYTVQYQAHIQDIGWQNWVDDGQEAGTTGRNLQLEALKVRVVPNGTALPTT